MTSDSAPSALVCSRNRADDLARVVRSLLASPEEFELLVIDQSDGPEAEASVAKYRDDLRLRYVRSKTRGKGAALNEGLELARGDVLVCTDDDCEAKPGWVRAMASVFEEEPSAAVAFCHVDCPPHDQTAGYVPHYTGPRRVLRSPRELRGTVGMGAGMAVRRDVILELGGFDEFFGPGSRFMSADDLDVAIRVVLRGWNVYTTGDRAILHHGFRTMEQGREHARRDFVGIGAACAKPIRAGELGAVILAVREFAHALWQPITDALHLKRPRGLARIRGFVEGFIGGLRQPVDATNLLFRSRAATQEDGSAARPIP